MSKMNSHDKPVPELEKGKPLRRAGVFQILAEEAWRDGEMDRADTSRLESFRKFLRLENQVAMAILDRAEEKYRQGCIGTLRDFSARQCYARAIRYAYSDDPELSEKEQRYLEGLRAALGLTDQDHEQVLKRLRRKGWEPGSMLDGGDSTVRALNPVELERLRGKEARRIPDDPDQSILVERDDTSTLGMTIDAAVPATEDLSGEDGSPSGKPVDVGREEPTDVGGEEPADAGDEAPPAPTQKAADEEPAEAVIEVDRGDDESDRPAGTSRAERRARSEPEEQSPRRRRRRRKKARTRSMTAEFLSPVARTWGPRVAVFLATIGMAWFVLGQLGGGGADPDAGGGNDYEKLAATFGANGVRVRSLEVRGPHAPHGPPLDLGEAWDLQAGLDGNLYGTASYRIFRIDPRSGEATWVAGTGRLGEPEEGRPALECQMDPASPRVDRDGNIYFRQGSAAIYRVDASPDGRSGKVRRVFGTREARQPWKDGDLASEARPGAIEQMDLDQAGRVYFDEYSGEARGPEILGRIEIDGKLRALFLFSLEPLDHSFRRLMKSFIGTGNGFENMHSGLDGGLYMVVGERLYSWHPGSGPPKMLMQNPPLEYAVARDGSILVVVEDRVERWVDVENWTRENRKVELVAGGNPEAVPSTRYQGAIPGTAAGYLQPRDLTLAPDGQLYLLDGSSGGVGLHQPRIDVLEGFFDGSQP